MNFRKFNVLLLFLSLNVHLCCSDKKGTYIASQTINSNQGVSLEILNFIDDGPKGFTLDYFPKQAIHLARVKECEITEQDSTSHRISRKVQFDKSGNITKDVNNFFSHWFKGTVRGAYNFQYNGAGKRIKMVGIPEEDNQDSLMTICNYNTQGLLYSRDFYQFAKRLKPNADGHLPVPGDFEKHPTWNKKETYKFSVTRDTVTIETLVKDKVVNFVEYQLLYDSLKRLKAVNTFRNGSLAEIIDYTYEQNSITRFIRRIKDDGIKWISKSKAVLNHNGKQIEKIVFNEDGSEKIKMSTSYNEDGTIKSIKYNKTVQEFRYSRY